MIPLFISAIIISFITLIIVIFLSQKYTLFIDQSNDKRPQNFHTRATPRAGGFGIFISMLLLLLTPLGIHFMFSVTLAFMSGIFEDFHSSLSPRVRLFLQLIAALCAIWLTNSVITYLGLGISMPYWFGIIFSAFAIVGMMNAINIIDGFNGLSSGVVVFILCSFGYISLENHYSILPIILISLGSTLGFMFLNFPKGKIFLGDGGAYLLGFIVAIIGIFLASQYEQVSPWYVLAICIYPVWEVVFSIIRKRTMGLSPMQPDKYHIHMLIYREITQNNPLTAVFVWIALIPNMLFSTLYAHSSIINICIILYFIFCYLLLYRYLYQKSKNYDL